MQPQTGPTRQHRGFLSTKNQELERHGGDGRVKLENVGLSPEAFGEHSPGRQQATAAGERSGHQVNTGGKRATPGKPSSRWSQAQGRKHGPGSLQNRCERADGTSSTAVPFFLLWCFLLDFLPYSPPLSSVSPLTRNLSLSRSLCSFPLHFHSLTFILALS